jgi:hypothetical protein
MKKILFGAIALMIVVAFSSCGASRMANKTPDGMTREAMPLTGAKYRSDADYYRATQNGESTERSIAQKIAMQNCRQDLAAAIQADMNIVVENYAKNQNAGLSTEAQEQYQYQEMAYTVVNQQLKDVQVVEEKLYREDDGSFRYYVCLQVSKEALKAAIEEAITKDAKLQVEFDRAEFKKIFDEKMADFAKE